MQLRLNKNAFSHIDRKHSVPLFNRNTVFWLNWAMELWYTCFDMIGENYMVGVMVGKWNEFTLFYWHWWPEVHVLRWWFCWRWALRGRILLWQARIQPRSTTIFQMCQRHHGCSGAAGHREGLDWWRHGFMSLPIMTMTSAVNCRRWQSGTILYFMAVGD